MGRAEVQGSTADVAICVATYRRLEGLRRLLDAIGRHLVIPPNVTVRVIVVNNDSEDDQPRAVCEAARQAHGLSVEYVVESRVGISSARNAAIDASGNADWIVFIDDDEVPQEGWLEELLRAQRVYEADVVAGPVVCEFEHRPQEWIVRGRFFQRPRHATGRLLDRAFTNNALVKGSLLRQSGVRFDDRFGRSGGEDVKFFRVMVANGAKIVWSDEAIVTEFVPQERANAQWLIRRMYRIGTVTARIAREQRGSAIDASVVFAKALAWIMIGTVSTCLGLIAGQVTRVKGRRWLAYGRGLLAGLVGSHETGYGEVAVTPAD